MAETRPQGTTGNLNTRAVARGGNAVLDAQVALRAAAHDAPPEKAQLLEEALVHLQAVALAIDLTVAPPAERNFFELNQVERKARSDRATFDVLTRKREAEDAEERVIVHMARQQVDAAVFEGEDEVLERKALIEEAVACLQEAAALPVPADEPLIFP